MANEIGAILAEDPMVPNSPMGNVGQAITQNPQSAPQISPEVAKHPAFESLKQWFSKPENMLTGLVLAGILMQDRRPGQSTLDAIGERGLGTLAFRGELRRLNQKDTDEAAKAKSEADYRAGQLDIGKERNQVEREGVAAQQESNVLTRQTQERMNTQDNNTRLLIAQMEDGWRRSMASMEFELGKMKETGSFGLDEKTVVDIMKNYSDAKANGVDLPPPGETVQFMLRTKIAANPDWQRQVGFRYFKGEDGRNYVDVNPEWRGLLGIPDGQGTAPAPTAAPPTGKKGEAPPKGKPKGYTSVPQLAPAVGLPDHRLGQSRGQGPHEAPPTNPTRPNMMYPGR